MRAHVLAYLGGIDVDVDNRGLGRELGELAGYAVVETSPHRDDHIRLAHGVIRAARPVHPQHPHGQLVRLGEDPLPHQGVGDEDAVLRRQLLQFRRRVGVYNPAPGIDDGVARCEDGARRHLDLLLMPLVGGLVPAQQRLLAAAVIQIAAGDVHGQVDDHRSRPAGTGDIESLLHHVRYVRGVFDQVIMLDDGHGDPGGVRLLEGIGADEVSGDLAGDGHHGDRIHVGVGDPGHQVGGPRSGGGHAYAYAAGDPRVAVGGMGRPLLVAGEHLAYLALLEHVENWQHHPARDAEDDLHTFVFQALN